MRLFTGLLKPCKTISGTDFAGIVAALGQYAGNLKIGDKVLKRIYLVCCASCI